ncbi:SDR family NAD(P)-dependent oxidoreductase [Nocardioides sp. NPDC101246]|uniref:SDR family NAD(P)-dependent oxidoreductase n=1 Tax=Nocardioides sp. NPDC101246 TaxID=3364336 RepID=UPI00380C23F1
MSTLTPSSPVRSFLAHPVAGKVLRGIIAAGGGTEEALAPALGLPLDKLVEMSGGRFPAEVVGLLVGVAETGVIPDGVPTADAVTATVAAVPADLGVEIGSPQPWTEALTGGRFAGQTVVVTGAAGGIGKAVAARIVGEGGRVVGIDVSAEKLSTTATELGERFHALAADITAPETAAAVLAAAGERVDALANVAGVMDDDAAPHEIDDTIWARCLSVNVDGPMRLMRAVLPVMLAAGEGRIVNVVSEAGLRGSAAGAAYTTSKHALVGLTKSAAFQYAGTGVRINALAPGAVATGIHVPEGAPYGSSRTAGMRVAIPGIATAEELAASITFLLSRDSVNINGAVVASDGGWSAA